MKQQNTSATNQNNIIEEFWSVFAEDFALPPMFSRKKLEAFITTKIAEAKEAERDENYREMNKQMAGQYAAGKEAGAREEAERIKSLIEGERLEHKPNEICRVHEACEDCSYNAAIDHALQHVAPNTTQ